MENTLQVNMLSASDVRRILPNVEVTFRQCGVPKTISCVIKPGRASDDAFATVMPYSIGSATEWYFSWDEIAESLNLGIPLKV